MTSKCNVTCVNWKHHLLDGWDIFGFLNKINNQILLTCHMALSH